MKAPKEFVKKTETAKQDVCNVKQDVGKRGKERLSFTHPSGLKYRRSSTIIW